MNPSEAKNINPLVLAYLGDAVYELRVREYLLAHLQERDLKKTCLHDQGVAYVNAQRQSELYSQVEALLTPEEADIFRRGRNARSGHQPPHVPVTAYRRATGVEALIGYLHLCGAEDRLALLFDVLFREDREEEEGENCHETD